MKFNMATRIGQPSKAVMSRSSVAIDGLDMSMRGLGEGGLYLIYADDSPARDAVLWQTAVSILGNNGTLISGLEPDEIFRCLRTLGIDAEIKGSLHANSNIFSFQSGLSSIEANNNPAGKVGLDRFLDDVKSVVGQCRTIGHVFLIEGIEAFISCDRTEDLDCMAASLVEFAERSHSAFLLMLRPSAESVNVHDFQNYFSGVAKIDQENGEYKWKVEFWSTNGFAIGSEKVPLRFTDTGYLQALGVSNAEVLLSPDENLVIVSRGAIIKERWVPSSWEVVDGNDEIVNRSQRLVAATVILDCFGRKYFEPIAQMVFKLRNTCGRALKIVVREQDEAIRLHYELFLLSVGANLVIGKDIPFARMESMIHSIHGQIYSKPLVPDFHAALSAALVEQVSGYVNLGRFIQLVRSAMDGSRNVRVPNILIKLPLLSEVAHIDALRSCRFRAGGDLCTATCDCIFIFFFACRMDDVDNVLQRVFAIPVADLFDDEFRFGDEASIEAQIDLLEFELQESSPADFTGWIERDFNFVGDGDISYQPVPDNSVAFEFVSERSRSSLGNKFPQQQAGLVELDFEGGNVGDTQIKTVLRRPVKPFSISLKSEK